METGLKISTSFSGQAVGHYPSEFIEPLTLHILPVSERPKVTAPLERNKRTEWSCRGGGGGCVDDG